KEVRLVVPMSDNKKDTVKVAFKVPKGMEFPQEQGSFYLNADQSGQPYDIEGSVSATHTDSPEEWRTETCAYQIQRQECYFNGHHHVCYIVSHTVNGW